MGQYYHVVLEKDSKRKYYNIQTSAFTGDNYECYNGLKIMEHSWWRNSFMNCIAKELAEGPCRLAWVGDYAEDDECEKFGFKYSDVWGDRDKIKFEKPDAPKGFSLDDYKYLLNRTKGVALDLKSYKEKSESDGWVINPISLLTAIGNGRGGGDYHECNPNFDIVGMWAFDELELVKELPDGDWEIDQDLFFKED